MSRLSFAQSELAKQRRALKARFCEWRVLSVLNGQVLRMARAKRIQRKWREK